MADIIVDRIKPNQYLISILLLLALNGCAARYFRDAEQPPPLDPGYTLDTWPYQEYWMGVVFNGNKIGFTHLSLAQANDADQYEIRSEAALRFQFLMLGKKVNLTSLDRVGSDLSLDSFEYDYDLDGSRLALSGQVRNGVLEVAITSTGQRKRQKIPINGRLYPTSAIALYPLLHGLEVGKTYRYRVYNGEIQSVATVTQEVLAYEESDLFEGSAYKIKTRLKGYGATTWIGPDGKPVLEMSMNGVIIAGLEDEQRATKYLALGALNKQESLLDFSLIRTDTPIRDPRSVSALDIVLDGLGERFTVPSDGAQHCDRENKSLVCHIRARERPPSAAELAHNDGENDIYLRPSLAIPSDHTLIRRKASEITRYSTTTADQVQRLLDWIEANIDREPVDVFTALDVLDTGKAECQGHTYLYTALARSLGIPTRVANGIVYSDDLQAFAYHMWAESFIERAWVPVDPTFGQSVADATHIKFIEGESLSDLAPLVDVIGRVKAQVITAR